MKVAVSVITYRRPEGLRRLLDGINNLKFDKCVPVDLRVVVADNDSAGSACEYCEEIRRQFTWPIECHVESRRGIPYARNKTIECAGDDVDFIAFIDDDEVPEPTWLDELLHVQQKYEADVVGGPVLPYFDEAVAPWIVEGGFFERPRHPTGTQLDVAATNNVVVRARILKEMGGFETGLGMTGVDDTHLFMRIKRAGNKIVWADEALVHELIPASRANASWILQRAYGFGNRITLCELDLDSSLSTRAVRAAKGVRRIAMGAVLVPLSPLMGGRHAFFQALRHVYRGAGIFVGLAGSTYEEYRKTHGA